jgi:hypothetical protein
MLIFATNMVPAVILHMNNKHLQLTVMQVYMELEGMQAAMVRLRQQQAFQLLIHTLCV